MQKKIVVIEDSLDMASLYKVYLARFGSVTLFHKEDELKDIEGIRKAIQDADLVISDYDGVPFNMIQAACRESNKALLLVSGNDDIASFHPENLPKPFVRAELGLIVARLLGDTET